MSYNSRHYNDGGWSTARIVWSIIAVFIGLILLGWGGYAVSVAMSGPKGVGDGIKQKNSASNWIDAQKNFEARHQEILALDKTIGVHKEALKADPKDPILRTNVTGATSGCFNAIADYNTAARSYLSEEFRSAELPYQIDETLPTTDCK